jgi:glyoxylate reductase
MNKRLVLVSGELPLDPQDALWLKLKKSARVKMGITNTRDLAQATALLTFVTDRVDARMLDRAPGLKIVSNMAVGYNNIDVKAAAARRIAVTNTPVVLTNATAELTVGLIFAAARRFNEGSEFLRRNAYRGWGTKFLLGRELAGSTLGIVGHGRIGGAVGKKAKALGMKVLAVSSRSSPAEWNRLLSASDFISIHSPLNPKTENLVSTRLLSRMKRGAYLINTARGEIVDEKALLKALASGRLAGAALDVFRGEPRLNPKLRRHPRVFVLPHLGSATERARAGMARLAVSAILEVLSGRKPTNQVN